MKIKHGEAFERLEKMRKKVPEINYAEELDLLEDITNLNTVRSFHLDCSQTIDTSSADVR